MGTDFNMLPVTSSNVEAVGYNDGILRVQFKSGRTYDYFEVSKNVYEGLLNAPSVGQYFNYTIKDQYQVREV